MSTRLVLLPLIALATPAMAGPDLCPSERQLGVLRAFTERLAETEDVGEAKRLALKKVQLGHRAIDQASRIVSDSEGIAAARADFEQFEATIHTATTSTEVAAAFESLTSDQQALKCDYTTVEIVIIVIGLVLGIIPGIIFLIVFC